MTPRTLILILSLAIFWGPAFMFMKMALDSFQPITIAALRVTLAAGALFLVLRLRGTPIKP
ncbi:MAG TPA: EamA family transporter, partial [Chlamydiales bacterium]|nr:EamA family transporter [Chlamydiales bacterium]